MPRLGGLRARSEALSELLLFLRRRKLWWMAPLLVVLLALAGLLFLASQAPVSPFIYTLF